MPCRIRPDIQSRTQKARKILADLSGYLAYCQTNILGGPAKIEGRHSCQSLDDGEKLIIFRAVLQQLIGVDDGRSHIIHREALRHRLTTNAFISLLLIQPLPVHQNRFRFLDALNACEFSLQLHDALVGLALLQPETARNRQICQQTKSRIGRSITATVPASRTS